MENQDQHAQHTPDRHQLRWAGIAHLSALVTFLGIPSFVGPLVIYLLKRHEGEFVADQAKEALNFTLSLMIYLVACALVMGVAAVQGDIGTVIAMAILLGVLFVGSLVFTILAAVRAEEGQRYRYPLTLRLLR